MAHANNFQDLTGKRFGELEALYPLPETKPYTKWVCQCSCGRIVTMAASNLKRNQSCQPCAGERRKAPYDTQSPEYKTWLDMKKRCTNTKRADYSRYGGKGVKVCDEWINSFPQFLKDMGPRPSKGYSIDRIDSTGDYTAKNCRWLPLREQSANRSNVIHITHNGKTQILKHWAEELGFPYKTLHDRYKRGDRGDRLFRPIKSSYKGHVHAKYHPSQ